MRNAKRGRAWRHGVHVGAVAALGFALSGCGGSGTSGTTSAAAAGQGSTTSTAPAQSTSGGSGASTGSTTSAGTTSAGTTSAGTTSASTTSASTTPGGSTSTGKAGSGSSGSTPPTASVDSVTINWTPPTENTNGSALTNLAGYNIHYGTSSGSLTKTISISNPGIATYVVSNLTPGKYYFAVAAVNSAGTESPLSAQVSTTVTN
jgi:Fibronectin type III domain